MRAVGPIIWAAGAAVLGAGLFGLGAYGSLVVWGLCQMGILALGYDLLGGMGREVHLGHGAFFGIGAYTSSICMEASWSWWAALVAAGAAGAILARISAIVLVQLRGASFAVASLCFVLSGLVLARNLDGLTGGVSGLSTPILGKEIPYACTFALLMVCLRVHRAALSSSWGRALRAAGEDPLVASQVGVSPRKIRTQALVVGSTMASLAGGIYPLQSCYLSPESAFGLDVAMSPVVAVLLGGPGTRWGALLGAGILGGFQELLWSSLRGVNLLVLGLFLMTCAFLLPGGIAGLLENRLLGRAGGSHC